MAATPPPGVRALQINNKQMDTYQLKIGPGRKDTVPYKLFNKKEMLDEVIALGFYSAWSTVKKDIEAYPGSELLVVADVDEIYGENWWIALTEEAKEAYFYEAGAAARAAEEAAAIEAAEAAAAAAAEAALNLIVVKEEPIIPRAYTSISGPATEEEVKALAGSVSAGTQPTSRPRLSLRLQKRRRHCGTSLGALTDRDTPALTCDLRPSKNVQYETRRRTLEISTQAGSPSSGGHSESASQTSLHPHRDAFLQCDLEREPAVEDEATVRASGAWAAWGLEGLLEREREIRVGRVLRGEGLRTKQLVESLPAPPPRNSQLQLLLEELGAEVARLEGEPPPPNLRSAVTSSLPTSGGVSAEETGDGGGGGGSVNPAESGQASSKVVQQQQQQPPAGGGWGRGGGGKKGKAPVSVAESVLVFLRKILPVAELALSQNETLNVYELGLGLGSQEPQGEPAAAAAAVAATAAAGAAEGVKKPSASDAFTGALPAAAHTTTTTQQQLSKVKETLKEERQLSDLELTVNKRITSVSWHPTISHWLCMSASPYIPAERRLASALTLHWSCCVLFTLGDFAAQVALEVPGEACLVSWCAHNPSIIAVAMASGQIALYDCTEASAWLKSKRKPALIPYTNTSSPTSNANGAGGSKQQRDATLIPTVSLAGLANPPPPALVRGITGESPPLTSLSSPGLKNSTHKPFRVRPRTVSAVDHSHSKPITGLQWLPPKIRFSHRGRLLPPLTEPGDIAECPQLLSWGMDGQVCVWDCQTGLLGRRGGGTGGLEGGGAGAATGEAGGGGESGGEPTQLITFGKSKGSSGVGQEAENLLVSSLVPGAAGAGIVAREAECPWQSHYRFTLKDRPWGMGIVSLSLDEVTPTDPALALLASGALVALDWVPDREGTGSRIWEGMTSGVSSLTGAFGVLPEDSGGGGAKVTNTTTSAGAATPLPPPGSRIIWSSGDDTLAEPLSVLRLPNSSRLPASLRSVFLCVTKGSWSIWRVGSPRPLLSSPLTTVTSNYCCGAWSPSRPSVFFLGRADGELEAWDLLESLSQPSVPSLPVAPCPLLSMSFRAPPPAAAAAAAAAASASSSTAAAAAAAVKSLAVGDSKGSIHIIDIPLSLRASHAAEGTAFGALLDRETKRVAFTLGRSSFWERERTARNERLAAEAVAKAAQATKMEEELQQMKNELYESDPMVAASLTLADVKQRHRKLAMEKAENAYLELEASILGQLGISAEEVAAMHSSVPALDVGEGRGNENATRAASTKQLSNSQSSPSKGSGAAFSPTASASGLKAVSK